MHSASERIAWRMPIDGLEQLAVEMQERFPRRKVFGESRRERRTNQELVRRREVFAFIICTCGTLLASAKVSVSRFLLYFSCAVETGCSIHLFANLKANGPVHRAAANDFSFEIHVTRGSVCNGWFAGVFSSAWPPEVIPERMRISNKQCCKSPHEWRINSNQF